MRYIAAVLVLALAGCATPKVDTLQVPIAVPCKVETPNSPSYRFSPPYDSVFDAVRDLMGDREVALAHQAELEAALKACK